MTYLRLGDYIREVNIRNRELKVTEPMGINIDKHFMPSVANRITVFAFGKDGAIINNNG